MSSTLDTTIGLLNYIEGAMVKTKFRGEIQEFLPRPAFDLVTREDTIRNIVAKEGWLKEQEKNNFVQEIIRDGRKLFVTCIYGELELATLRNLLIHGLRDSEFPYTMETCPALDNIRNFRKKKFIENQRYFGAAFFSLNSEQSLDNNMPKPIDYDENEDALLGKGAFGEVFKIGIHPDQRSFSSGADKNDQFAMKVTPLKGTREVKFHREMEGISHQNLLKCLASFTFSSKYHMIYEKADCNLEEFMQKHRRPTLLSGLSSEDLAQQFFGLADALCFIHNQGGSDLEQDNKYLGVKPKSAQRTGYIHDIKPENLLLFIYKRPSGRSYWFRLSDFSCAKVVDYLNTVSGKNRLSYRTTSAAGTPVYRAPEAMKDKLTSRPYDLWSLGCVYLELLVWFLDGYDALIRFREDRYCPVSPNSFEDEGFYYAPKENKDFRLRKAVEEKIDDVLRRCTGTLKEVAKVIPDLLKIDPKQRPTAEKLVKILKHIDNGAKPHVDVRQSGQTALSTTTDQSVAVDSDSDSSFGEFFKVQHPTEE